MIERKLTLIQEKYLSEIESMIISHTTKENPNYKIAKKLEKMGFLELIESESPLIRTVLTDAGKEYMSDRYETLYSIRQHRLIESQYVIYEKDKIKGIRITRIDINTGEIIRELK